MTGDEQAAPFVQDDSMANVAMNNDPPQGQYTDTPQDTYMAPSNPNGGVGATDV